MRLIDADKAKAELLRIARDIHDCCGFYDGLKAGYQSAGDRLDTMPTVEERDKGYWIDIDLDTSICSVCKNPQEDEKNTARSAGLKWTVIIMVSKYIQYFLNENNLELGEEFMLADENGRVIYKDKTFFFKNTPTSTSDLLVCKDEENFCPTILLGLLTGLYYVKKKPWQPEIGDVYFYVAVDDGRDKGVIHTETLFNKNDIKFLLLKKAGKYYKSYFEAEKHLKEDYEYLTGE